jgi:hypothetical protein
MHIIKHQCTRQDTNDDQGFHEMPPNVMIPEIDDKDNTHLKRYLSIQIQLQPSVEQHGTRTNIHNRHIS